MLKACLANDPAQRPDARTLVRTLAEIESTLAKSSPPAQGGRTTIRQT
jgi:hypothetical protein